MATPLTEVYNFFLSKVENYSFVKLNEQGKLEAVLYTYLIPSIVRFTNCNTSLEVDEATQSFVADLSIDEKEILATFMLLNYLTSKTTDIKNLQLVLSERDYAMKSQANHLTSLISLKKDIQSEVSQLLNSYSIKSGLEDFD